LKQRLIWDLPVRVFHWALLLLLSISAYTALSGGIDEMDYHMLSGYGILTLLLFRIIWGFVARGNARFSNFVRGPSTIWQYVTKSGSYTSDSANQEPKPIEGHNPLGALSIIAILLVLLFQAVTGLFANDDIFLEGPLTHLVSYTTSRQITEFHKLNAWLIVTLSVIHIGAIAYYEFIKKDRLTLTMITGRKQMPSTGEIEQRTQLPLAFVLIIACGTFTYYLVKYV